MLAINPGIEGALSLSNKTGCMAPLLHKARWYGFEAPSAGGTVQLTPLGHITATRVLGSSSDYQGRKHWLPPLLTTSSNGNQTKQGVDVNGVNRVFLKEGDRSIKGAKLSKATTGIQSFPQASPPI